MARSTRKDNHAIIDAITSVNLRALDPISFCYGLIDILGIALRGPYFLQAISRRHESVVIRTGDAGNMSAQSAPVDLGPDISLFVLASRDARKNDCSPRALNRQRETIAQILETLETMDPKTRQRFEEDFSNFFTRIADACDDSEPPTEIASSESSREIIRGIVESVLPHIKELEDSLERYDHHPLKTSQGCLNLIIAFRDFQGPKSRIHYALTKKQKEMLSLDRQKNQLQRSLFGGSDGPSQSLRRGFAHVWYATDAEDAEARLFRQLVNGDSHTQNPRPTQVFTVPVHLGGVPWMTASVAVSTREQRDHCFALAVYRDLLPPLLGRIRQQMYESYIDCVFHVFEKLEDFGQERLAATNHSLRWLGHVYPFRVWDVKVADGSLHEPGTLVHINKHDLLINNGLPNKFLPTKRVLVDDAAWSSRLAFHDFSIRHIVQFLESREALKWVTGLKQARAWAHDVKNYTQPLYGWVGAMLRREDLQDQLVPSLHDLQLGLVILNAVANAAQYALSARLLDETREDRYLSRLKKETAEEEIARVLEYLLDYHRRVNKGNFELTWSGPVEDQDRAKEYISVLQGKDDQRQEEFKKFLSRPDIVGIVGLLREVVWNLRLNYPLSEPREVNVHYSITMEETRAIVTIVQRQVEEKPWPAEMEISRGIDSANWLYGSDGGGIGYIEPGKPSFAEIDRGNAFQIEYTVRVFLFLK